MQQWCPNDEKSHTVVLLVVPTFSLTVLSVLGMHCYLTLFSLQVLQLSKDDQAPLILLSLMVCQSRIRRLICIFLVLLWFVVCVVQTLFASVSF